MHDSPGRDPLASLPTWVSLVAVPIWITTPQGVVDYINPRAEALIGLSLDDCAGHACFLVIAGRTPEGAPLCCPQCRVRRLAAEHHELEPVRMSVPARGGVRQEVKVMVIVLDDGRLVHCVVDGSRELRVRRFIDRIALRTTDEIEAQQHNHPVELTLREREILTLLAEDRTLHEIAERLGVSYTTVRNHVQHILGKLGVHSILEAVAVFLLNED